MSPTTVTRIIAHLEQSAGAPLLARTTRTVHLTEDGAIFLRRSRAALIEIDEAFETICGGNREPHGTLTVTAPVMFGRVHVLPIVIDMLRAFPDLQVRLLLLDRVTNMVDEEIDVAVRIGVFSASPGYVGAHGEPMTISDLRNHALVNIEDERGTPAEWQVPKRRVPGSVAPRLSVNSMDAAISAAIAGLGIMRTLSYQVARHFADGTLVPVVTGEPAPAIPVSVLFQSGRRDTPNIRAFLTLARQHLSFKAAEDDGSTA